MCEKNFSKIPLMSKHLYRRLFIQENFCEVVRIGSASAKQKSCVSAPSAKNVSRNQDGRTMTRYTLFVKHAGKASDFLLIWFCTRESTETSGLMFVYIVENSSVQKTAWKHTWWGTQIVSRAQCAGRNSIGNYTWIGICINTHRARTVPLWHLWERLADCTPAQASHESRHRGKAVQVWRLWCLLQEGTTSDGSP